jgi:thioredoxin reductase
VIHRRDELRATKCIQEKCFANEKIEMQLSSTVKEIQGADGKVAGVLLGSTKGEDDFLLPLDGVFIFVGVDPVNTTASDLADLDEKGYIKIDHDRRTTWPGLFAAGDVTDSELKEIAEEYGDKIVVGKLNVDENPTTATKFDVLSIPTLLVFANGQVAKKLVGAMPKKRLIDELSTWIG